MSSSNTSCVFLSLFGPGEQLFLSFTRGDRIVIQDIRPSTICATALTSPYPVHLGQGQDFEKHKESPFTNWWLIIYVWFTKQKYFVCILFRIEPQYLETFLFLIYCSIMALLDYMCAKNTLSLLPPSNPPTLF